MDKDEFEDEDDLLEMSEEDDVPTLAEIQVLAVFPVQINEKNDDSQPPTEDPITNVGGYRHARVQEKRNSQISDSVRGHHFRLKRIRLEGEAGQTARVPSLNIARTHPGTRRGHQHLRQHVRHLHRGEALQGLLLLPLGGQQQHRLLRVA